MTYTPFAEFRWSGGRARVVAGGLIGRATHASLRLAERSISEAHALLTLRDGELRLQALRGELRVDTVGLQEVSLRLGMEIALSDDVVLTVSNLEISQESLAFIVDNKLGMIPSLPCSVVPTEMSTGMPSEPSLGAVQLIAGCVPGAALMLQEDEVGLWSQLPASPWEPVRLPAQWSIQGHVVRLVAVPMGETPRTSGGIRKQSLRISVRFDSVHIVVGLAQAPDVVTGIPARILSELALLGNGPVSWEVIAREIWSRDEERMPLRDKWDKALQRLRRMLGKFGVRDDLVRIDRHGNVEIVLYAGDSLTVDTGDVQDTR